MHRRALAALLAVMTCAIAADTAMASWPSRCNGERRLCERRLDRVVLPAAHNAMSAASLGWQIPNQQVGLPEQLRAGVRGFLIDTHYGHPEPDGRVVNDPVKTPQSRLYLCHVLCGLGATPLVDGLRAMRAFLRARPANVLVIVNEDNISPADFAAAVKQSGLIRNVYRRKPGPRWPKLKTMIRRRQQVVMLAERQAAGVPWYHEAYGGIVQETPYSWPIQSQLTDPANWPASCRPLRGGTTGSLFLMNHWSPTVAPSPATSAVVNARNTIVGRAKACRDLRGKLPNLVAVDMFQSGGLFAAVRRLNRLALRR